MDYLLDTVTLVRYLSNTGKLTAKVKTIFAEADKGLSLLIANSGKLMALM